MESPSRRRLLCSFEHRRGAGGLRAMHVGEDLEVVDVANVLARIDVNPDGRDSAMPAGSEAARYWVGVKWGRGVGVDTSRAASTSSADRP
jgi:hypothetical protein